MIRAKDIMQFEELRHLPREFSAIKAAHIIRSSLLVEPKPRSTRFERYVLTLLPSSIVFSIIPCPPTLDILLQNYAALEPHVVKHITQLIHKPENGMMLDGNLYILFDQFIWCLRAMVRLNAHFMAG
jgi:HNH endonuclease